MTRSGPSPERRTGLREGFLGRLPRRCEELDEALHDVATAGGPEALERLRDGAHQLRGSAGSYGFPEVGRLAGCVEDAVADASEAGMDVGRVQRFLALLRREIEDVALTGGPSASDEPELSPPTPGLIRVDLLEDDPDTARLLAEQLRPFGYAVTTHRTGAELVESVQREIPGAILLDISLEGDERGTDVARSLPAGVRATIPLVFVTVHDDLESRIEAVRSGAAAYMVKPVDSDELADLLNRLTRREAPDPVRVLIVEDTVDTAELYATTLAAAGMTTRTAADATEAMHVLRDFAPELILMDLYLPGIRGDELAEVIRQQKSFHSIPIVFVSAEQDESRQMRALARGGDDFLTKPVDPATLASSIRIRAERYRLLRATMQRDSLTGLLNHRHTKEALHTELTRAGRTESALSVAMIDIDHFKAVNDSWGHPAGDRVIRSLARILTQRLRRSDVIGRYGGEEFMVVMPDTPVDHAVPVLEELRSLFAAVVHSSGRETFTCSLSCGVVEARPGEADTDVLSRADEALYRAKSDGRDRVVRG